MGFKSNYDDYDEYNKNDDYMGDGYYEDDDSDDDDSYKEVITYYCNDCNYRWQKAYSNKNKEDDIDSYDDSYYDSENSCPMCGSSEVDRI